jgi:WD40 repeat protein
MEEIQVESPIIGKLASDPHMDRVAFSSHNSIWVIDRRASTEKSVGHIPKAHEEIVTSIDFNPNRQNTILSSSQDRTLKVWDLRRPELPILIHEHPSNPIESVRYNPVYDQLMVFASTFCLT